MISVIISIYNTAPYLKQCVKSVTQQDFRDLEIILINDKSTDQSLKICHQLAQTDPRIRIIDLEQNVGIDRNRFVGLEASKGEYVMFVDSDDWLEGRDCISAMYNEITRTDADYVEVRMQRVMGRSGLIRRSLPLPITGEISKPKLFDDYYLSFFGVNILPVNICGKMYKRDTLINAGLKPSGYVMGEDLFFNMQLFPKLKKVSLIDKIGYNYRFGGMTSKHNPNLYNSLLDIYHKKKAKIEEYDYQKAHDYIRIEIKNVLKSDICQAIRFIKDETKVMALIRERLSADVWHDLTEIRDMSKVADPEFVNAVVSGDVDGVYKYCKDIVRSQKMSYYFKRLINKIFKYI